MTEVSTFRLYLMRALYLLIFVGQGSLQLPRIIHHANALTFSLFGMAWHQHAGGTGAFGGFGHSISATNVAAASLRTSLEGDMVDLGCAAAVVSKSIGPGHIGVASFYLIWGNHSTNRHSLALCFCKLREETWG
jgi:hypothetical protein